MAQGNPSVQDLVECYERLLGLFGELETVSSAVFESISCASGIENVRKTLGEKMAVADEIKRESQRISGLKKLLQFSENDRIAIRNREEKLSAAMGRVVEQEDRVREAFTRQGMNISRP